MFVPAIEAASGFTRPVYSIERLYGSREVFPGAFASTPLRGASEICVYLSAEHPCSEPFYPGTCGGWIWWIRSLRDVARVSPYRATPGVSTTPPE